MAQPFPSELRCQVFWPHKMQLESQGGYPSTPSISGFLAFPCACSPIATVRIWGVGYHEGECEFLFDGGLASGYVP